ncbi:MAG: hypothetical protein ABSA66_20105 [Roseiarcus sp.]|jgi:hypothetical protein
MMASRRGIYVVPTDRWHIERTVWLIAGFVLVTATALAVPVNPLCILLVAATGYCILANVLFWIGAEPRLNPGALRAESHYSSRGSLKFLEGRLFTILIQQRDKAIRRILAWQVQASRLA